MVLCRKDENYDYAERFPNDTPCEKHKEAINFCKRAEGIISFLQLRILSIFKISIAIDHITSHHCKFIFFDFDTVKIFASRIHVRMEDHAMERTDHVIVRLIVRELIANLALEVIFNPFLQRIIHYIQSLPS